MHRIHAGQKFGKWTALHTVRRLIPCGRTVTKWKVRCDCGNYNEVSGNDLNKGKSLQCRACYGNVPKNLEGKRFGKWIVLRQGETKNGKTHWICKCDCENEENVCASSLLRGLSTKCLQCCFKQREKHGYTKKDSKHPLYSIW